MGTTRAFTCSDCSAMLVVPLNINYMAYYWRITPTGRATCPPCLAVNGRVIGAPRARTRAVRTGHTYSMTGNGTAGTTPDTGLVTVNLSLPEFEEYTGSNHTGVPGRVVGGMGEEGENEEKSRRRDVCPEQLQEFDRLLRTHRTVAPTRNARRRYEPSEKYYERLTTRYGKTPGLDFTEEAERMLSWMSDHPSKVTDVVRFSERWLDIAQEQAVKRARANGYANGRYNGKPQGVAQQYKMGATDLPDDVIQSGIDMDRRGRSE